MDAYIQPLEDCPAQSPYLKIIEPLWRDLKKQALKQKPRNLTQGFWDDCQEQWENFPNEKNLNPFPSNGSNTNYYRLTLTFCTFCN